MVIPIHSGNIFCSWPPPGRATLLASSRLHYLYLAYFSKPQGDRAIYKAIARHKCQRFLELGVGSGLRAERMIHVAARHHAKDQLRYVGIDLFEARTAPATGMSLKDAHRAFKNLGVAAQLVPGDPFSALARAANALRDIDLVLISADQDAASLERAWFYLPRVLHAKSLVLVERANPDGTLSVLPMDRSEVDARARKPQRRVA
jgi:predicted O-methyltransferase YrrM